MKKNLILPLVILLCLFGAACDPADSELKKSPQYVHLRFETSGDSKFVVLENVLVKGGALISNQLDAIEVIHGITGQKIMAYAPKATVANGKVDVERCYVFTGRCMEYGTLVTDTNSGVQLFFPADTTTKLMGF